MTRNTFKKRYTKAFVYVLLTVISRLGNIRKQDILATPWRKSLVLGHTAETTGVLCSTSNMYPFPPFALLFFCYQETNVQASILPAVLRLLIDKKKNIFKVLTSEIFLRAHTKAQTQRES